MQPHRRGHLTWPIARPPAAGQSDVGPGRAPGEGGLTRRSEYRGGARTHRGGEGEAGDETDEETNRHAVESWLVDGQTLVPTMSIVRFLAQPGHVRDS
jgi:hypothetical protein